MSGFAGFLDIDSDTPGRDAVATAMADSLRHRGTSITGPWHDDSAGIAIAMRQPADDDAAERDPKPMESGDGRWIAALDGTLYNRHQLGDRLEPVRWRSRSEMEVLLEAVARWGVERTLAACDGSFALVLWDRLERRLYLARDRMGEKPLYWALCGGVLMFGSQLRALRRHPAFDDTIGRDALGAFLRLGAVPAPHTIYQHARRLNPGSLLSLKGGSTETYRFWSAAERAAAVTGSYAGGPAAAAERLNQLLRGAVAMRLHATAPTGVLLGGETANTLIAAIGQELSAAPLASFSISYGDTGAQHERDRAGAIAAHLGTRHTHVDITDGDILAQVGRLPLIWDEPFADTAQLPTLLLAQAMRGQVGAAVAGTGASLLFGGRAHYGALVRTWNSSRAMNRWTRGLTLTMARLRRPRRPCGLRRTAELVSASSPAALALLHRCHWRGMPAPVPGSHPLTGLFAQSLDEITDPVLSAMLCDQLFTLPDKSCAMADRAGAVAGVQTHAPFLDPAVMDLAWSLPPSPDFAGTSLLQSALLRYLPPALAETAAIPLASPLGRWLTGPLRDWADDLLSEPRLKRQGLVNATMVAACWRDHRDGRHAWHADLWPVLMLQAWLENEKTGK